MSKYGPSKSDLRFRVWASVFGLVFAGFALAYRGLPTTIGGWEAIGLAVLFFGGVWGMWGVFFAIPLATLVKAVINAWPRRPTVAQ